MRKVLLFCLFLLVAAMPSFAQNEQELYEPTLDCPPMEQLTYTEPEEGQQPICVYVSNGVFVFVATSVVFYRPLAEGGWESKWWAMDLPIPALIMPNGFVLL